MNGSTAAKTIYTCPMHPEIEQDHPGDCPKCGMGWNPRALLRAVKGTRKIPNSRT